VLVEQPASAHPPEEKTPLVPASNEGVSNLFQKIGQRSYEVATCFRLEHSLEAERLGQVLRGCIMPAEWRPAARFKEESWFRPIVFAGIDQEVWELTVPNETFRASLLENHSDLLRSAISEVLGAPGQFRVSMQEDNPSILNGLLPVVLACGLKAATGCSQWLIENLWLAEAVAIVGGPPRAYESWLALDMAVSVACSSPCRGVFPVGLRFVVDSHRGAGIA
jgi:hypothetical protein